MTTAELAAIYEECSDDQFLKFDAIPTERRLHRRADLNAFLLLDKLVPGDRDMVCAAAHDQIFLEMNVEDLVKVATRIDILDLMRSGVRYCEKTDSLEMFV